VLPPEYTTWQCWQAEMPGKIFTCDPLHPHWGLVREADDGTLYRGGQVTEEALNEAVERLCQEKEWNLSQKTLQLIG
jgi:hypothetical protein